MEKNYENPVLDIIVIDDKEIELAKIIFTKRNTIYLMFLFFRGSNEY